MLSAFICFHFSCPLENSCGGLLKEQDPGINLYEELQKWMWNSRRERKYILNAEASTNIPFIFCTFQNYEVSHACCRAYDNVWTPDTGHRTPDTGHRTPDTGHWTKTGQIA